MGETISTAKGLSIEYDEDIVCDICRSVSVRCNAFTRRQNIQ